MLEITKNLKFIVFAGPNGSGKSTLITVNKRRMGTMPIRRFIYDVCGKAPPVYFLFCFPLLTEFGWGEACMLFINLTEMGWGFKA